MKKNSKKKKLLKNYNEIIIDMWKSYVDSVKNNKPDIPIINVKTLVKKK